MRLRDVVAGANASMYYRTDFRRIKAVYYPQTERDAVEAIAKAREMGYDVTPKGAGSGLSGACTGGNRDRVIITTLRMNRVLSISPDHTYADVQPGATPDEINAVLAPSTMRFHVTPSSRDVATVGGMLSTDSGGNDAWLHGTMRDNTLRAKILTYDGKQIEVGREGVRCEDTSLEDDLNRKALTLNDIADAHGLLGFVTELRLALKPIGDETVMAGLVECTDISELGSVVQDIISAKIPVTYGETVIYAHPDIRGSLNPPLLVLEFPEAHLRDLQSITRLRMLTREELAELKDIRLKLAKRTPKRGLQISLFEDYGFYGHNLSRLQERVERIDSYLREHSFEPLAKYGHAPTKWYMGDNTQANGIIMHSNEIKQPRQSSSDVFETAMGLVRLCEELGVTPKPEHKWIYSDYAKLARIRELREVIGGGFNSFILDPDCGAVLSTMIQ
ncbi:MAG: hypothetical protein C4K47_09780 [Candidatus Thorarchaeota archaeon]|nr:MAG: hypothetical protein C4K47_09780 [Candidatus Thorarchaeota archaeon]